MTPSFRSLLLAGAALAFLAPGSSRAKEVKAVTPGMQSAPAGAVKGKAAEPAPSALPPGGAPVTAAQASAAEAGLKAWIASLLGPALKLDRPVQMTPAGDHFDVAVPIQFGDKPGNGVRITATARPMEGGKWAVAGLRTTLPATFTLAMPMPPKEGAKSAPAMANVTYTVKAGAQDGSATIDPTFATASTWTTSAKDITVHSEGGPMAQDSVIGATQSVTTMIPAGPDRVDVRTEGTLSDYAVTAPAGSGTPAFKVGMESVRLVASMSGVSRSRATTLTQSFVTMFGTVLGTPAGQVPNLPPELIGAMVGALQDFASELKMEESVENLAVKVGDQGMTLEEAKFGLGAKSDNGILQASMELAAAGLELPDMPLGPMEALIPQKVAFRPFVTGVAVADLARIATTAGQNKEPTPADIQALFSHGGIVAGLESMLIEVGGATFTGQGKVTVSDPATVKGAAQVTVEDFDALFKKVSAMPMLAQQGVPVMIFLKGIGRTVNGKLVYDISYSGDKVLVNDVDLMAMAGGAPPANAGPPKAPVRPNQRTR